MDVYLSQEAYQSFEALSLASSNPNSDGLLIGHKRGHRFFVEKIFPSITGFFSSKKRYFALDQHFEGKILGFFSFKPNEKKIGRILTPFAYAKLFLEIHLNQQKKINIKSYIIDYEKDFFLSPIQLKSVKSTKRK